ncbi:MAG: hypothetical protein C4522_02285 [Desulfobacteraceae bacterium]|nr:MAG: hypothetical protein C4522_02285 [Desulfobacteraceae bacterium]
MTIMGILVPFYSLNREESSMKTKEKCHIVFSIVFIFIVGAWCPSTWADDTDIYKPKVKHNVIILLDTSDSMGYGVYDNDVDYHAFYRYISTDRTKWINSRDAIAGGYGTSAYFYPYTRAMNRTKIYMVYGNIGFANGITGDAADPDYVWWISSMVDMKTYITAAGELEDETGKNPGETGYAGRVSTEVDATTGETMITIDGRRLPNNQDRKLHDRQENPDGSRVDKGFAGLIRAPGYTFSGYFYKGSGDRNLSVTSASSSYTDDPAAAGTYDGKEKDYFLITGNWINMQMVYNLEVEVKNNDWQRAWEVCTFPAANYTPVVDFSMTSPNFPADYYSNYDSMQDGATNYVIYNGEADKIRFHFSDFSLGSGDKIEVYDQSGDYKFDITSIPADGWSNWVDGGRLVLRFVTDDDAASVSSGWKINAYQYQSKTDYNFFSRLEVASAAMIDVVETTRGKVNWGVMMFTRQGGKSKAAPPLNPSFNDDQQKQSIINALDSAVASGDSHLGEAMQDVFNEFHSKVNQIHRSCNKNFVITLTDGYPDADDDWIRIPGINFADPAWHDDPPHNYTQDPFQYASPNPDYYDDVAHYMYTHSYVDYSDVAEADRKNSPDNILVHNIGFSNDMKLLEHASDVGGGIYLTAFSKSQLVNAFYSLGLMIAEYSSYTAPVVSVDEANRVQSGDKLYMALFKPNEDLQWSGNLKKYGLGYGVVTNCGREEDWFVVDKSGLPATDCDGNMLQETSSFWSTRNDGGEVEMGGAGQILYNSVPASIGLLEASAVESTLVGGIPFRNIFTCTSAADVTLKRVATDTITNTELQVLTDADRYKIINFLYGYTYDAHTAATALAAGGLAVEGSPVIKNSWPLGPIIHSSPKLLDYFDSSGVLTHRYIAVGANDGMLHVFDDTNGREIFAFVPTGVLSKMKEYDPALNNLKVYTVDGSPMLMEDKNGKKILFFGLRRGGREYYAMNVTSTNPANWTVLGAVSNLTAGMGELALTFAQPGHARIKTGTVTDAEGKTTDVVKNILIIPGGYDANEDKATPEASYELTPSHKSSMGRAIYIFDLDLGTPISSTYFHTDVAMPAGQTQFAYPGDAWASTNPTELLAQMKYCFAADPVIITDSNGYMKTMYIVDLYGQVWKMTYALDAAAGQYKFYLYLIFKANPRTDQASAYALRSQFLTWSAGDPDPRGTISFVTDNQDNVDNPRKTFFTPDVSYAGNCYTDVPVLYMGTGDREHPTFIGPESGEHVRNGLYAFYDAHAYRTVVLGQSSYTNPTSTDPSDTGFLNDCYSEKDLLNVTCGALEPDIMAGNNAAEDAQTKTNIDEFLRNETKGYFIRFSDFSGCINEGDNAEHYGEKALSPVTLFAKKVFVPTYQPINPSSNNDPCVYDGVARLWAVDYCDGNAAYNLYTGNDTDIVDAEGNTTGEKEAAFTRGDRYVVIGKHIPSGVSIIVREGEASLFVSVGGKIATPVDIDLPLGMIPLYWKEILE